MEANNDYRVLDLKRHNYDAWEQSLMDACSRMDAKHFLRGTVLEPRDEIEKADFLYKRYQVWMRLRFSTQEIREESGLAGYLLDEMDPFKVYSFIRYNFGPDQSHTATQTETLTPISYPLPGIDAVTGAGTDKVSSFVLCHKFFNIKIANYDTPKAFLDEFIRVASQLSTTDCALPDRVKLAMLATQFRQLDPRGMTQLYYDAEMNKITYRELLVICHKRYTDVLYNDCNDYGDYNDSPGQMTYSEYLGS